MKISNDHSWTQTRGEEIANWTSHAAGLVAAVIGTPLLVMTATKHGARFVIGVSIFAATVLLLYLGSAAYHAWPRNRFKHALRVVDHSAIFLLIAGTYTPFALGPLRGTAGWTILVLVWLLAAMGIVLKAVRGPAHRPGFSIALYLAMGWLAVFVLRPLAAAVPLATIIWMCAGGLIYTGGVIFFLRDHRRYWHFVWHLFVLGGTCCHYCALLSYARV